MNKNQAYLWGNNKDRKRRRIKLWEASTLPGVGVRCHFCVDPIATLRAACIVRWPKTAAEGGRFIEGNTVLACAKCARSSKRRVDIRRSA